MTDRKNATANARADGVAAGQPPFGAALLQSNAVVFTALFGATVFAFFTTWFLLSPFVERADRSLLNWMVVGNIVIAAGFAIMVGVRLWNVLSNRRHEMAGSRTHLRLITIFSVLAAVPAGVAFLFAFTILRTSLNDVFSDRIDNYVNTSREFANTYFQVEAENAGLNLNQIAFDLEQDKLFGVTPQNAPIVFRRRLVEQALVRDLAALIVIDGKREIIASVEVKPGSYRLPPQAVFDAVDAAAAADRPLTERGHFDLNDDRKIDLWRAMLKVDDFSGGYIVTYRSVPESMSVGLRSVRSMRDDWNEAKLGRSRLERVFLAGYIILAIIILFGAIWSAIWAATRIVQPIGRLVNMAEKVSGGELRARVEVHREDGELGVLARSMNHMTAQLQTQRDDLVDTNRQFDERRRFTEAVLYGVSSGVMGLAPDGRITIVNRSASELLSTSVDTLTNASVHEVLPELSSLMVRLEMAQDREVGDQLELTRGGISRTLNVRIVRDQLDGERRYVATFDDISELIAAQRNAAWGDVARRIAHEIKNPLTPIQLSAERLRRKYQSEIVTQPDIFERCTETIIRQVSDIRRMVDEFSSFARMPKPVIKAEDIRELVKSAVFPQKVVFSEIEFEVEAPDVPCIVECDGRLIVQALTNLVKNGGESISARLSTGFDLRPGRLCVTIKQQEHAIVIDIVDNGIGLPQAERHRLTEPYMTTREKGTGLGLAIVRKIAEEHGGFLRFNDDETMGGTGARMTISLPRATMSEQVVQTAAE